jgi:hypothetical protein
MWLKTSTGDYFMASCVCGIITTTPEDEHAYRNQAVALQMLGYDKTIEVSQVHEDGFDRVLKQYLANLLFQYETTRPTPTTAVSVRNDPVRALRFGNRSQASTPAGIPPLTTNITELRDVADAVWDIYRVTYKAAKDRYRDPLTGQNYRAIGKANEDAWDILKKDFL